jgi:hypothetical protein
MRALWRCALGLRRLPGGRSVKLDRVRDPLRDSHPRAEEDDVLRNLATNLQRARHGGIRFAFIFTVFLLIGFGALFSPPVQFADQAISRGLVGIAWDLIRL